MRMFFTGTGSMRIENKKIEDLIPAEYNPRKITKRQFEDLKGSITEFGYIEPIIWNATTGHVVGGHQRLKALTELRYKEVECVVIECPEEKEKMLSITLNKVNGTFEKDKLFSLLSEAQDLSLTGFNPVDVQDYITDQAKRYYADARERTYNLYRLNEYDENRAIGDCQIPRLKACHYIPERIIPFDYVRRLKSIPSDCGVHFFVDDYQFERIWREPHKNFERLKRFACTFTPQFSMYIDMPFPMKMWNLYRSMLIGQMMQDEGLTVIPTLSWADEATFDFCFDGIEPGSVVAASTVGVMTNKEWRENWKRGMAEALKRLRPECVLLYGYNTKVDFDFGDTKVKVFETHMYKRSEVE